MDSMTAPRTCSASRRGGVLMGVALTLVTLVVVAAIVGLTIARNVKVDTTASRDGDHVTINTPAGSFSIQAHEHGKLPATDLPIYPGARPTKDSGGADFQWTSADGRVEKGLAVAGAEFITSDSASSVYDFYQAKLPGWVVSHEHGQTRFEESPEARGTEPRRFVVIHGKADGTHIGVATVGAPAAN
jgi:hypothetical protein